MVRKFDAEPWSPVCVPHSIILTIEQRAKISGNVFPNIIFWDPLVQFPQLATSINKCVADNCEEVMTRREWQDGRNKASMPRVIHGIDGIVLLVSRIYVCNSGHRCISHDERILLAFPSSAHLPFVLTHRSCLTSRCLSLVISLIEEGKRISAIEAALRETRKDVFYRNCLCYAKLQSNTDKLDAPKFEQSVNGLFCPGKKILPSAFLQNFWNNEIYYRRRMHNVGINSDWICCDHTFKSITNIGIYQPNGSGGFKWVKQFKSLFIVLNDIGQVLSWQFADDTSMDTVCELLREIKTRLAVKKENLREIYVDDCCKVRYKLQDIFGHDVLVKLDLFHAMQRITKKASKRHPLFNDFVTSLKHVFRNSDDIGEVRLQSTPEPQLMQDNIIAFVERWKDVTSQNGQLILTTKVSQEINKLRTHIGKGCLSRIKPGRGTNRDESLHKRINSFMKYSKVGVELAYALLMSEFDRHNEDIKRPSERQSVLQYKTECILGSKNMATVKPPKYGLLTSENHKCSHLEEEVEQDEDLEGDIDDNDIVEIIEKVKALTQIIDEVEQKKVNKAIFNERFIPFMNSAASLFQSHTFTKPGCPDSEDEYARHAERLNAVVRGWGFETLRTEGDGNCFFSSVAIALSKIMKEASSSQNIVTLLENSGICVDMTVPDIAKRLRQLLVGEWLNNSDRYQPFLSSSIQSQAQLFLQSGHFMGELGNTMPLALSNILSSPIIVFTSLQTMPVLLISPSSMQDALPAVYLAFNQFGAGHYDAVISNDASTTLQAREPVSQKDSVVENHLNTPHQKCYCGRKSNLDKSANNVKTHLESVGLCLTIH